MNPKDPFQLRDPEQPSDLELDQLHQGELPTDQAAALRQRIASDEGLKAKMAEREQGAAAFDGLDMDGAFASVWARVEPEPSLWQRVWDFFTSPPGMLTLAVGVAALVAVSIGSPPPVAPADEPGTRAKGGLKLRVFLERDGVESEAISGDSFHKEDQLRFEVDVDAAGHGLVLYTDAKGGSEVAWPMHATASQPITPGKDQPLEGKVRLDDSQGTERLELVVCAKAFTADAVPADCKRTAFTLVKP